MKNHISTHKNSLFQTQKWACWDCWDAPARGILLERKHTVPLSPMWTLLLNSCYQIYQILWSSEQPPPPWLSTWFVHSPFDHLRRMIFVDSQFRNIWTPLKFASQNIYFCGETLKRQIHQTNWNLRFFCLYFIKALL